MHIYDDRFPWTPGAKLTHAQLPDLMAAWADFIEGLKTILVDIARLYHF
ncbi:hypothetical protein CFter6_0450 [Collimonas fungivorans]|uniref:Uncharacterized protein n=1 Tax=Collimonas fungivorans TaxID=158899 RepID=A0A127P6W1_9BURK|nr:hypothetical protein [Collimonas fungivorans]AMO93181.1 hypothetical protein CFter6_0450 [Collimonas fungivorans]